MSEEEQNKIRFRSWDNYLAARDSYLAHRARLAEWGKEMRGLGDKMATYPARLTQHDFANLPGPERLQRAVGDFHEAVKAYKEARVVAQEFGFFVNESEIAGLGSL